MPCSRASATASKIAWLVGLRKRIGGTVDWMSPCMRRAWDSVISPMRVKSPARQATSICLR